MTKHFVRVLCDVHCDWQGEPPDYRVFVNDELFAERTYIWTDSYIEELLQISAPAGKYIIRYELVQPHQADLNVCNVRVDFGPASMTKNTLRIHNEMA